MGKHKVVIYKSAQRDLQDIVDYLNNFSVEAAYRYYDLLVESIASLSEMPKRCPYAKGVILKANGYRMLAVESYLVFYIVQNDVVQIRRIIYGKRQYEDLL